MTEGAARSVAVQSLTLLPEFPHLALAHVALAIMQEDPDLKNGDLKGFLRRALVVPGANGAWGSCGEWLEYLCPRLYTEGVESRDWRKVRARFSEAKVVIDTLAAELAVPKRMSVFIDASTWGLKSGTPSKRKMKAALAAGNALLSLLDDEGFDVHFHYEADADGEVEIPTVPQGTDLYVALRPVVAMGKTACLSLPAWDEVVTQPAWEPVAGKFILQSMQDGGFQVLEEGSVERADLGSFSPNAKLSMAIDFPIGPRAGEAEVQAWAAEFAAILTRGLIAADDAMRQTVP